MCINMTVLCYLADEIFKEICISSHFYMNMAILCCI